MVFDYSRLLGKIKEKCATQAVFAQKMKVSERTASLKLNGKVDWKSGEIVRACEILGIGRKELPDYFFKK